MNAETFGKVAVMLGGSSAERDVSLKSGMAVLKGLVAKGIDAHAFDPAAHSLQELVDDGYERVFIALHGRGGEDGAMQGALQVLGIPYTGSDVLGCALGMDKVRCKQIWHALGLPTASWRVITQEEIEQVNAEALLLELGGRVIVKPAREGSSIGMSSADSAPRLAAALKHAAQFDDDILVEQWIEGPEYTIGLLDGNALPVIRLQTPHEFYDFEAKYQANDTQYHCPAGLSDEDEAKLRSFAERAFSAIGASGWGRIDVMRSGNGDWFLLEANTVPGMTEKSLVPMAAKAAGLNFNDLVERILAQTLER
ncbi:MULTISPECIES: D-alanine--D-alanine ligase [Idiomarina]|uniref:D-alanine--D-alanine ligase n=1 Tax=Idiomarina abyssalis TaxID=86102 RepID=A0A8I1GC84_9GAMM|nr:MULTISPECIES: D-alanine--D-alanine ligase [Idiomarina]MBJ7266590.1 D-alanine--D-alanine ligase [Idiomarina abyssalis]MBJ7273184.1 D-alanine--D-alanine ligase [Idiomarina abyssalis]MBJ7315761.1 D-alanine--D-alanine ligase [Idiomarina abyssalis]MBP58668.1 D-alanine--D-alanine ligase [Idiomarina sp.]|tara:strand:- start:7142 stop:8071 length:930 start_codon:yes stop_codon:yes gene_type:complete